MNVASLRSPVYVLALSILAAAACGTADVPPKPKASGNAGDNSTVTTTGTAGDNSGTAGSSPAGTGGSTGSSGSTGASGTTMVAMGGAGGSAGTDVGAAGAAVACPLDSATTPLPLTVDTFYAASGYMGDGATAGTIAAAADCPMRAPGNIGNCSKFTYTALAAGMGWGGVYWQSPANNWGTLPGKHIEPGATKVTFYAAGAKGGEVVSFIAGGIQGISCQDPAKMQLMNQVLTTTMTQYSIDLTGYTYTGIIGAFGWTVEAKPNTAVADAGFDITPVTIYVDGIQWVK